MPHPHHDAHVPGFDLPPRPAHLTDAPVAAWSAPVVLPTYLPTDPDRYPAYLDRRVYQGSSGRVYPLPFHDRISETRTDHAWTGLHLENAYVRLLVLPELGGRIQLAVDKRTGYPLFYANPVIKPALVGLAGPWLAGGVEFNWPQHHRPATFLPTAWEIDESDGTVWCSDHDPFARMKGMHGVRLQPDSTVIELRVRLFNRSEQPQTFLWWANVAAEVHDDYQSFFPSDVTMVADHAKRAVTTFPSATTPYYGVDYAARRDLDTRPGSAHRVPGDRLDWPRNIPVPTSYMCVGSSGDFFGGYDHRAGAGFVHWADHHHAVGKKQWTWGDEEFGRTWNRNLDENATPYIELMAGVYTDNQPDFSHLAPGETKVFSQHWYPVAGTGVVVAASLDVALGREVTDDGIRLVLDATRPLGPTPVRVSTADGTVLVDTTLDLGPEHRATVDLGADELRAGTQLRVVIGDPEQPSLDWNPLAGTASNELQPAVEPAAPEAVGSVEELYLIGRHMEQYRHATRSPEPYWEEALRRDPGHVASHTALGTRRYEEGRFPEAEQHARRAIERLTCLNPNPETGDAHYLLGLALVRQGRDQEAYDVFAKATWLDAWVAPGNHQLAVIDARHGRDEVALQRARAGLRARPEQLQLRNLTVLLLRRLGRTDDAEEMLAATLQLDPLDVWARQLAGTLDPGRGLTEAQTLLDVALESARAGELRAAVALAEQARLTDADRPLGQTACGVLADYHAAGWLDALGDPVAAAAARDRARFGDRTWTHPSRLDDVLALEAALAGNPSDPTAAALLGHWCYAHRRPGRALELWRRSAATDPGDPVVWRNIAVAAHDVEQDPAAATQAYERALQVAPGDPRLVFESDQLRKRIGAAVEERLARLEEHPDALAARDDLSVEYAQLLVAVGRFDHALAVLTDRRFQPWEGGEGQVLKTWERVRLALADAAQTAGDHDGAVAHVRSALDPPPSLGESRHPLANPAALLLALGDAYAAAGRDDDARACWRDAAEAVGDFADMAPSAYSENTCFSALAARRLGDETYARQLVTGLTAHLEELVGSPAGIDYFATSLPSLMLFDDDPQRRRDLQIGVIRAQLAVLAGDPGAARVELDAVLASDPAHELALDLRHRLTTAAPPPHHHREPDVTTVTTVTTDPATTPGSAPWVLPTATGAYVVGFAGPEGGPVLQHWGPEPFRPWEPAEDRGFETAADRLPSELSALGTRHSRGADLIVDHGDGLLGARLVWSDEVEVTVDCTEHTLRARATDTTGHLEITLVITTSTEHDAVRKHAVITNSGDRELILERAFAPAWELPVGPGATVDLLGGHWAREFGEFRVPLVAGELSIGSRQGITSHTYSPVLGVSAQPPGGTDGSTTAYGVALAWPGSWRMLVDAVPHRRRVRVTGGVDDESGRIRLEPGASYRTPDTIGIAAPEGADGLRHRWHDLQRGRLARDLTPAHRPVLYNSWYATTFDVRPEHQLQLAQRAADLGADAFVVDDGWFAGRDDDRHGLGNWWPDPVAFPDGLDPLIAGVLDLGLRFGIWVEPEAVNPTAEVLQEHPDWIYRAGDRPLVTSRNQYVLDLGRPDVRAWTADWLRRLLADERISYLKWDMNRPVSDGGRPGDPHGRAWSVQHAEGYLELMRMLRAEFPHVTVEACSGGGGRIDLAVLEVSDVVWPSDETGPRDRLAIQHGFLSAYGPHVMSSWVTDEQDRLDREPVSLEFRFLVGMAGVLGIGADLTHWSAADLARGRDLVELYRRIRPTMHTGRVELHERPGDPVYAVEYGAQDQTVVLVYARGDRPDVVTVAPRTLRPERSYRVAGSERTATGAELAAGVVVPFALATDADVLVLDAVE